MCVSTSFLSFALQNFQNARVRKKSKICSKAEAMPHEVCFEWNSKDVTRLATQGRGKKKELQKVGKTLAKSERPKKTLCTQGSTSSSRCAEGIHIDKWQGIRKNNETVGKFMHRSYWKILDSTFLPIYIFFSQILPFPTSKTIKSMWLDWYSLSLTFIRIIWDLNHEPNEPKYFLMHTCSIDIYLIWIWSLILTDNLIRII